MQLSAFHQDRANRLPEQTQRRVYGSTARAQRRGGGIVKIFHWEGEPQRELDTATTTSFVHSIYSNHGITYLQRRDPLPLIQYKYIPYGTYTQPNRTLQAEGLSLLDSPTFTPLHLNPPSTF